MAIKKIQQDLITGHIKQSLADVLFGIPIGYLILIGMAALIPQPRLTYMFLVSLLIIGIIGISASIWLNASPNLWAKFLKFLSQTILWLIISYRSFEYFFPTLSLFILALIFLTVAYAQTLPIWKPEITSLIRNELYAPKSQIGKVSLRFTLAILPFAGFIGASLQLIIRQSYDKTSLTALILGPLGCGLWLY